MMMLALALICSSLVFGEKDGYREVSRASDFHRDKKVVEGEAFIKELRERPREKLSPVQIQGEDMAEFALYREDESRRTENIALLKKIHAAGPETIWGWAAYGFLDDYGATNGVALPKRDPYYHLGNIAAGVLDFEPKRLESKGGATIKDRAARLVAAEKRGFDKRERLAILRTQLVKACGEEAIDRLLGMREGEKLFDRLWKDEKTLSAFLLSGPAFDFRGGLELLMTFFLNDPEGWTKTDEGRKIAVALALNVRALGKTDDPEVVFLKRMRFYAAYRRLSQRKLLDPSVARRTAREWRFILREPREAVDILYYNSIPFDTAHPGRATGHVPYRGNNCFGGSIFSKAGRYYDRWRFSDWPQHYIAHRVGGVCGNQSVAGSLIANAHGFMAETAGQPMHCAWLFRNEEGGWDIKNNINKYTAGTFMIWGRGYQYVQATERAFAQPSAFEKSELLRFTGELTKAISACPYNLSAWQDYRDALRREKADAAAWRKYLKVLASATPEGRTATWDLAFEGLGELHKLGCSDDELLAETIALIKALPEPKKKIFEEMDYQGVVLKRATSQFKNDPDRQMSVLVSALAANAGTPTYFSGVLKTGMDTYGKDEKMCARFLKEVGKAMGEGTDGKTIDFRALFRYACDNRQREVFQTLADLRNRLVPPPAGELWPERDFGNHRIVSTKGLLTTSGRMKGDCPEDYPRVLDVTPLKKGRTYQVAIKPPEDPQATLELPGLCRVFGVVVTGENLAQLTISASDDGQTWKLLHTEGVEEKALVRANRTADPVQAKFVRVGRVSGASTEPLRLAKILVYGETFY